MQIIKTIIKFIILHRWNRLDKNGLELMNYWYKLNKRSIITKIVFNLVLNINGIKHERHKK